MNGSDVEAVVAPPDPSEVPAEATPAEAPAAAAPAPESAAADAPEEDSGEPAETPEEEAARLAEEERKSHLKWYVVHTYSGFETRAQKGLAERIKMEGLEEFFGEILVPVENVVELVRGSKRTSKRKFFPGYMLVQMELNTKTWHCVKSTPKITGFVGNARNPVPVREADVLRLTKQIDEGTLTAKPKVAFEEGEHVRVVDGPFSSFNGVVEDVKEEKQKLRVLVSIFGRATPVELDFMQVEKTTT